MTTSSATETVPDQIAQEHEVIQAYLKSNDWEERLRTARLKREEVLAERARQAAQSPDRDAGPDEMAAGPTVFPRQTAPAQLPFPVASTPIEIATQALLAAPTGSSVLPESPAAAPAKPLGATASPARRVATGLGIGMAAGLVIGLVLQPLATAVISGPGQPQTMATGPLLSAVPPELYLERDPAVDTRATAFAFDASQPLPAGARLAARLEAPSDGHDTAPVAARDTDTPPEIWPNGPAPPVVEAPEEAIRMWAASLPVESLSLPAPAWRDPNPGPDLTDAIVPSLSVPERVQVLAYAPPRASEASVGSSDYQAMPAPFLKFPTLRFVIPDGAPSGLVRPANPDAAPVTPNNAYFAKAESFHVNVHVARAGTGAMVKARLEDLGLMNATLMPSRFGPAQTIVIYYRAEDAEAAVTLARIYGGQVMDMTGFAPAPPDGTLDLYLTD